MIIIKHSKYGVQVRRTLDGKTDYIAAPVVAKYARGRTEPHFPMPAIRYTFKWVRWSRHLELRVYRNVRPGWSFDYRGVAWWKVLVRVIGRKA